MPSAALAAQIPAAVFSGPIPGRDQKVLQLLQRGKDANGEGNFKAACACFEAAYALSVRAGMLVSAANMRLKLGQPEALKLSLRYDYGTLLASRGVQPGAAFDTFGEVLLKGLGESLGDGLPEEAASAWKDAYADCAACMQEAFSPSQLAAAAAAAAAPAPAEAEAE